MGSLRLSMPQDILERRSYVFLGVESIGLNSWGCAVDTKKSTILEFKWCSFLISTRIRTFNPSVRLKPVQCSKGSAENTDSTLCLTTRSRTGAFDGEDLSDLNLAVKDPAQEMVNLHKMDTERIGQRKNGTKIWRRVGASIKKSARRTDSQSRVATAAWGAMSSRKDCKLDALLLAVNSDSSIEECNIVLKRLEKQDDEKALNFFEWMRGSGKLKKNADAYHLALRALARKEDWKTAGSLLQEVVSQSECQLNVQLFNALIFVCAKRRFVHWGAKWFRKMIESAVQPDIATFGMLMGLYQKANNLTQAEYTFEQMRRCKIKCVNAYSAMITIYTRSGFYARAELIIDLMKEDEVLPNLENWFVQINAYSQQGKMEEAELVLKSMAELGVAPNIVAYNTLITGYGKIADMKRAKQVYVNLQTIGLTPDETTYRSMLEGFGRADDYKEALFYYKELKGCRFVPNSSNFYTMINLQARHGDERGAIQTLKDMRLAGCQYSSIFTSVVQAFERVGKLEMVLPILQTSFYEQMLHDSTSCSIFIMACIKNSLLEDALCVLRDKKWVDLKFENNLYHLLICSCKDAGQYADAVKIYSQMPKSDLQLNTHIACSMIDVYSCMDKFASAEDLYLNLKASTFAFDLIAYSIVVRMYIKAERLKDVCSVLEMMEKQKDIVPDKCLFHDMLRTYQRCGLPGKLANTYYWTLRSGIQWDEAMYNCVINCCRRALPIDELSRIFDEMIQNGHLANTITFNVMVDVYGKAGLLSKARKILVMARKQGLADIISYNTIIAAYGKVRDFKGMTFYINRMQNAGYPISLEAYNCLLDAYGKENRLEEFDDVLQKMREARSDFDHYTYNIMINIYGKKGWIEDVANVLAEFKRHGLEPDLYSYNTLIKAYGIAGMAEEAVNVLKQMRTKKIIPDRVTYSNLVAALQRNENFLEAVKWSLWMKQIHADIVHNSSTM